MVRIELGLSLEQLAALEKRDDSELALTDDEVAELNAQVMLCAMEESSPAHYMQDMSMRMNMLMAARTEWIQHLGRTRRTLESRTVDPTPVSLMEELLVEIAETEWPKLWEAFEREGVLCLPFELRGPRIKEDGSRLVEPIYMIESEWRRGTHSPSSIGIAPRMDAWLKLRRSRIWRLQKRQQQGSEKPKS